MKCAKSINLLRCLNNLQYLRNESKLLLAQAKGESNDANPETKSQNRGVVTTSLVTNENGGDVVCVPGSRLLLQPGTKFDRSSRPPLLSHFSAYRCLFQMLKYLSGRSVTSSGLPIITPSISTSLRRPARGLVGLAG